MSDRRLDVLFVQPSSRSAYQGLKGRYSAIETPTWALLLTQSVRAAGYGAEILDCDAINLSDVGASIVIQGEDPRLVVFCVYGSEPNQGTVRMADAIPLATFIKQEYPERKICFAGSHAQALPKEVLSLPCVDFVLLNEGVYALRNLLATDLKTDLWKIEGIGWKPWSENGCQEPILNDPEWAVPQELMDQVLPGYAWDALPEESFYRCHFWHNGYVHEGRSPFAALYTSLGCPFKCHFCWVENTKVIVANGRNKKIQDITTADTLVGYDEETGDLVETRVTDVSSRVVSGFFRITLSDGKVMDVTGEHPLYSEGKWIKAEGVRIGTPLLVIDPYDKVSLQKKLYNPMKREDVARKVSETFRERTNSGEIVPWMCTSEGKRIIGEIARKKQSGKDNPMKNPETVKKFIETRRKRMEKGDPYHTEEGRLKKSELMRGEKHYNWRGGISGRPYPYDFSRALKRFIKKRDNYTCQVCGHYGKGGRKQSGRLMHVHHIDYNKDNNTKCNLILLCECCHPKTNYDRPVWQKALSTRIVELGHEGCPHYVEVSSVIFVSKSVRVYNFECSPYSNYFANYVLGHNCMINLINRADNHPDITASHSNVFRYWSAEHTLKQIEGLVERGIKNIRISDEMFMLNPKHYVPIVEGIKERWGDSLNMWAYARVDTVQPKRLELFRSAGIRWLCLGIEAGDTQVRKEASKGSFQDVDIRDVVKEVEDHDIDVISNFIFGLPHDTFATMEQTLDLACELNTRMANFYPSMPLPGTVLYQEAKKNDKLPTSYAGYGFLSYECTPLGTDELSPAEVVRYRDEAFHTCYSRPAFHDKVEKKFGSAAVDNIKDMLEVKLKRKILGE